MTMIHQGVAAGRIVVEVLGLDSSFLGDAEF
jgi:hypothetical protein